MCCWNNELANKSMVFGEGRTLLNANAIRAVIRVSVGFCERVYVGWVIEMTSHSGVALPFSVD